MRVDPIKPTLNASGSKRLKLEHDKLLSNFAFNFSLRRYRLDELFPGSGLEETFNANDAFRTDMRRAMRKDLFVADPSMSDRQGGAG